MSSARTTSRGRRQQLQAALSYIPNEYDESDHELALVHGLKPDTPNSYLGCAYCADLPWRRHRDTCKGCGEPYADEPTEELESRPRSALAAFQEW